MTGHAGSGPRHITTGFGLAIAIVALGVASVALTAALVGESGWRWGMMGQPGAAPGPAMMRGFQRGRGAGQPGPVPVQPGQAGFVPGTQQAPRVIRIWAGPGAAFSPAAIAVARGETVTFEVTVMGPSAHEFMVGPADAVAADAPGTPEIDAIGMMQTRSLTYTFDGPGPYAFACHAPGHYEAGMRGTITVVG